MSDGGSISTIRAACDYIHRGWMPVPIPARRKQPVKKGWPALRLTESDVSQHFGEHDNIGLILGEPSGWQTTSPAGANLSKRGGPS